MVMWYCGSKNCGVKKKPNETMNMTWATVDTASNVVVYQSNVTNASSRAGIDTNRSDHEKD